MESATIARIEAKYLMEGERTAVLNGESFYTESSASRKVVLRSPKRSSSEGKATSPGGGMLLDRDRLLNMPKFT